MESFQTLDWIAIAAYFGIMLAIVWWVVLQKQRTSTDYFLAGKNAGWLSISWGPSDRESPAALH